MLKRLFRERAWGIGIASEPIHRFLDPDYRPKVRFLDLPLEGRYFADPFGVVDGTTLTVLCEEFTYRTWQGTIVALRVDDPAATPTRVEVIADEHHMSYPYLIEDGGTIYCVPERAEAREVALYAARPFPTRWTRVATLLDGVQALDPTIFRHEGLWWLAYTDGAVGMSDNLCLSYATELRGPWRAHPGNPVKRGAGSARPGGTPFVHEGVLYRPAQDGSHSYGGRIAINRVTELTPTSFSEEETVSVGPDPDGPFPTGLHTLSAAGPFTLLDGRRDVMRGPRIGAAIAKARRARQRRRLVAAAPRPPLPRPAAPVLVLGGPRSEKIRRPLAAAGTPLVFYRRHGGLGLVGAVARLLGQRPRAVLVDGSGYQALVGWLVAAAFRRPFIVRLRGDIWTEAAESLRFLTGTRRLGKWLKFRLGDFAIARADGVIPVSRYLATVVARRCPQLAGQVVPVPTPVEARYLTPDGDRDGEAIAALGLAPEQRVVLTVTTFDYVQKAGAIEGCAPYVAEFLRRHADVVWVVAGAGSHFAEIGRRLAAAVPPGRLKLAGFVGDVRPLYRRALFFLYFSFLDALPSVVQEAKAHGLPVVVNDAAGLPELVTHGRDGYVVPTGDGAALLDRMDALYADPGLRAALGSNGRQDVLDRFRDATVGDALSAAIEAFAHGPQPTRRVKPCRT